MHADHRSPGAVRCGHRVHGGLAARCESHRPTTVCVLYSTLGDENMHSAGSSVPFCLDRVSRGGRAKAAPRRFFSMNYRVLTADRAHGPQRHNGAKEPGPLASHSTHFTYNYSCYQVVVHGGTRFKRRFNSGARQYAHFAESPSCMLLDVVGRQWVLMPTSCHLPVVSAQFLACH